MYLLNLLTRERFCKLFKPLKRPDGCRLFTIKRDLSTIVYEDYTIADGVTHGEMDIVAGNEHGDKCSNPGWG